MGLFSSKKITRVGTAVSRVIKDESLPNAIKTGVMKAILNDGNVSEYALEELIGGIGVRAERAYDYGRTTYAHGLPSGRFKAAVQGQTAVAAVLTTLEGVSVTPLYSHFGPPNKLHIGWMKAIADHGYNPATNQLGALTTSMGKPVYLDDMVVVVPSADMPNYLAGALDQWGTPATAGYTPERISQNLTGGLRSATPVHLDTVASLAYIRVDYVWIASVATLGVPQVLGRSSFNISLAGYNELADYFHAKYTVGAVTKYWMYQDNLGTYPSLDAVFFAEPQTNGTFFPFLYFRYNSVSETSNKTTSSYLTAKKLAKYYGMNYDTVANAINENPDIADVTQALMIMAVPANTTDPLERRYLFALFNAIFQMDSTQFNSRVQAGINISLGASSDITKGSLVIQDSRFKMALSNEGVYKSRVVGSIGAVGTYTSGFATTTTEVPYIRYGIESDESGSQSVTEDYHYYRKQISKTLYEEIRVVNLRTMYYIHGGLYSTGDDLGAILLIPLDHSITDLYSIQDREKLYARAMHYVYNSVTVTKLKWYQQGWFADLMQIISIVVIVVSLGSATGPLSTLMSAIQAGSAAAISAALVPLIEKFLIGVLIGAAFKVFVKAVGIDAAIVLAVFAAVAGFYQAYQTGAISGAPWAEKLLQMSSGITDGIKAEVKDLFGDLIEEFETFNLFKDEATKQLEAANKLLEHNNWLSPFVIFGEKPDDYYNRTIHSGNVGVLGLGAISQYVDNALKLPKLDETLEG